MRVSSRNAATAVAVALLATGCASLEGIGRAPEVPAGGRVTLSQALETSPGVPTRVYVQDGRVVPEGEVNRYAVHCFFRLERQGDEALAATIEPDRFEVTRPSRSGRRVEGPGTDGVRVAAAGTMSLAMVFEEEGAPLITFYTELALRSERQPQVHDLSCRHDGGPYEEYGPSRGYPTLEQINDTLGEVATVTRAGDA